MGVSLVAVDMDGTFLRPDMTYDRERFLALRQRMREAKIPFVVASGNQYWQLRSFFDPSDDVAYAAENGHYLYEVGEETPFSVPTPRPKAALEMISILEEKRVHYLVSTPQGAFIPSWAPPKAIEWTKLYYPRSTVVEDVRKHANEVVRASMVVEDPYSLVVEFQTLFSNGDFVPVVSGSEDLDLNARGHNKAVGLQALAKRWRVDLSEAIAFGDSHNDLEMLGAVGLPVAMDNAHSDVRNAAVRIAPSNFNDGVLEVLDEVLPR